MKMKRLISVMILAVFVFSQTSAYAQGYAISSPVARNADVPLRSINMNSVSKKVLHEKEREKAMLGAIFEAEYREKKTGEGVDSGTRQGPMVGKREREIITRYETERKKEMLNAVAKTRADLRTQNLRKIKRVEKPFAKNTDLVNGLAKGVNERIAPFKISGEYQLAWGYDWGDVNNDGENGIWKDADFNKANMVYVLDSQYMWGPDRDNTYDKRIYDRFRLKVESLRDRGFNVLSEVVVDPWSFVGKTDYVMINSPNGQVPIELRYWSGTESTLDERIWFTNGIDFVNVPEIKVSNGRTHPTSIRSGQARTTITIPELKIYREFKPLRKLESSYKNDYLNVKFFALADQDHAYVSDDPLMLSNRHIYWEPSPWLNNWEPALFFTPTGDFRRGRWANGIAYESRDSDFNFLTLLRGMSLEWNYEDSYLGGSIATPINLWQEYESINSLPGALRAKQRLFDNYYIGGIYTFNYGLDDKKIDAYNHVIGFDAGYEIPDFFTLRGEIARSMDRIDRHGHAPQITYLEAEGNAVKVEAKGQFLKNKSGNPMMKVSTDFAHMGDNFRPRLSNYRNTRQDQYWSKHITFEPISEEFDSFRIGDGMDIGRNAYHFRLENMFFNDLFNSLFDMRFVTKGSGGKIENVYREEVTLRPLSNLSTKFLFRYQEMPGTVQGRDPYIITDFISGDNTDEFLVNGEIEGGRDAAVWMWSGGFHYDPVKWLGFEGIYERTNDHDIFPQYTLNDAAFRDLGETRELLYFLYSQGLIAVPSYEAYDIYKARIFLRPHDRIRTKLEYVMNEFKHATGRDDNISHYGVEVDIDITDKLRGSFKFIRSQVIDLFQQQQGSTDVPFYHHNNIFAKLEYDINDNNTFVVQFGEFFIPAQFTPISWILNTVDTQKIIRFYLKGKF